MLDYTPAATQTFLAGHFDEYLRDLATLVNVDCGTHNREGVNWVGRWLAERCAAWGWEVERYPATMAGDCWRATLRGDGQARLLLLGHLDTVYPDGTAAARPMRIDGNVILGPGVADMKSGVLTGLWALRALQEQRVRDFAELSFFANSDEEVGSPVG